MKKIISVIKNILFVILIGLIAYYFYVLCRNIYIFVRAKKEIPNIENTNAELETKADELKLEIYYLKTKGNELMEKNVVLNSSLEKQLKDLDEYAEGNIVEFGKFEFDGIVQPKKWWVLERQKNKALLLSMDLLGAMIFGEIGTQGWAESAIRQYLNITFLKSAFTEEERSKIEKVSIDNTSDDFIFLLSIEEANKYLNKKSKRAYYGSYNVSYEPMDSHSVYSFTWWLRDPGPKKHLGAIVDEYGRIHSDALEDYSSLFLNGMKAYVRPALWIKIEDQEQ